MASLASIGGAPRCPRCSKAVYFAEEAVAKGKKWHKSCLTCASCNKGLDSFTMNEHENDVYCKGCFGKSFGPKGYGYAGGSAGLQAAGANAGTYQEAMMIGTNGSSGGAHKTGCPRCGKTVYFAEEKIAIGRKWHKMCLKCAECNKLLDSTTVTEHDGEAFCKSCYGKLFGPKGYGFAGGSAGLSANNTGDSAIERTSYAEAQAAPITGRQSSFSSGPKCPRCLNTVYFAEEIIAVGKKWHKSCLKCDECGKSVDPGSLQEHEGMPYCRGCYGKHFGPKGYGFAGGSAGLSANSYDDGDQGVRSSYATAQGASVRGEESSSSVGPKCSRCNKTVYFAEEVIACRRKWHKLCLKCEGCNKLLGIGNIQEHDEMPYCKQCYGKHWGPKGYGFAGGSAGLSANSYPDGEEEVFGSDDEHVAGTPSAVAGHGYAEALLPRRTSNFSGAPECPRCGAAVYFAEEVFAIGMKWHKTCLKCNSCGKKLDTSTVTEHDREIYCKACYGKHFGPKGYGFAGGAAGMLAGHYEADGRVEYVEQHSENSDEYYDDN